MKKWHLSFAPVLVMILTSCGGSGGSDGSGGNIGVIVSTVPAPVASSCYDGKVDNIVGVEDPFYSNAWHLKNTGPNQPVSAFTNYSAVAGIDANVEKVHQAGKGCTGKGITIAIVDSAMEIGHEDLTDNVVKDKSWNFDFNTNNPSPTPNQVKLDHGTGVAGIAAARGWNGKGSRGVAPFASLVAFSNFSTITDKAIEANIAYLSFGAKALADQTQSITAAFGDRANATSIFNFSKGNDYAAPTTVEDLNSGELAVKYGTTNLRNGRGAIYFQSAGNEFYSMAKGALPDSTTMAVNCPDILAADAALLGGTLSNRSGMTCGSPNHEPTGKPYFYQVAAIHNTGKASSYSSAGAANWITGFGGEYGTEEPAIITTDNSSCTSGANNTANMKGLYDQFLALISRLLADLFGENPNDTACNYTGTMNGTSSAAPSVSGVAALMLEANPRLTWQDVGYILAKTARKVDATISSGTKAVTYTPTGGTPWNLDEPWITNAASFNFQNRYGFGLVDANEAVKLAVSHTAPAGRRSTALTKVGAVSTTSLTQLAGVNSSTVTFDNATAITGPLRLDLALTNNTGVAINMGFLQFEVMNTTTKTKSILLPAFTSWYAGGKDAKFKLNDKAQQKFRLQTNAFFGEAVAGTYEIKVVDFSGASGAAGKTLNFVPTLTSFSI